MNNELFHCQTRCNICVVTIFLQEIKKIMEGSRLYCTGYANMYLITLSNVQLTWLTAMNAMSIIMGT